MSVRDTAVHDMDKLNQFNTSEHKLGKYDIQYGVVGRHGPSYLHSCVVTLIGPIKQYDSLTT